MRYEIKWRDYDGHDCLVSISQFRMTDSTKPIQLTAAAQPFVTEENDDTDLMKPVRTTTGRLNVLCHTGDIIPIERDNEWRMVLERDGEVMFRGFLKSEAIDMDYSAELEEFSYTVIDDLEALKCWRVKNYGHEVALDDLLADVTAKLNDVPGVYPLFVDNGAVSVSGEGNGGMLTMAKVDPHQWYDESDKRMGTCYDMLDDVCTSLGLTARTWRGGIYLQGMNATGKQTRNVIGWRGEQQVSIIPAAGSIKVSSGGKKYSMDSIRMDTDKMKFATYGETHRDLGKAGVLHTYFKSYDSGKEMIVSRRGGNSFVPNTGSYFYEADMFLTARDVWEKAQSGTLGGYEGMKNLNLANKVYIAQYLKYWGTEYGYKNRSAWEDSDIDSIELRERLEKQATDMVLSQGCTVNLVKEGVVVSGGALDLQLRGNLLDGRRDDSHDFDKYKARGCWFLCRLYFGGQWWNGKSWQKEQCEFKAEAKVSNGSEFEIKSNKNFSMPFTANGYVFPIRGIMRGRLSLSIYGVYENETGGGTQNDPENHPSSVRYTSGYDMIPIVEITTLELGFCDEYNTQGYEEKEEKSSVNSGTTSDSKDVSAVLCCGNSTIGNAGLLTQDGKRVGKVEWTASDGKAKTGSIADMLLEKYKATVGQPQTLLKLCTVLDTELTPAVDLMHKGKRCTPVSVSCDWVKGESTLMVRYGANFAESSDMLILRVHSAGKGEMRLSLSHPIDTDVVFDVYIQDRYDGTATIKEGDTDTLYVFYETKMRDVIQEQDFEYLSFEPTGGGYVPWHRVEWAG